jgi:hypothetical protein
MKWNAILLAAVGVLLAFGGPAFPGYTLRTAGTAEGGGTSSAGQYDLTFSLGQTSPVGESSNQDYSLSSGLLAMLLDVSPPVVLHQPPQIAPARAALGIEATIVDDRSGVGTATIFYHEGGLTTFRWKQMQHQGGRAFSGSIPPSGVTEKGLVYYIEALDNAGNLSRYPQDAPDSVVSLRVYFEDLPSAMEMPAGKYRMISLPGSTNGNPDSVLADDFGDYDRTVWKLGRWNASKGCTERCYDEYPDVVNFAPGRAFWLISKNAKHFDFSGLSLDITSPFPVHLEKGWNQIGTPFDFTTDWLSTQILFRDQVYALDEEHIVEADTLYVEDNLVSYDGTYHGHQSALEPWVGYWIYNGSTQEVDLLLHPEMQGTVLTRSPYVEKQFDVLLALKISSRGSSERTILAGTSPHAEDGWDVMDHREPPPIGDYFRLVFDRSGGGAHSGKFMSDIKTSNGDGITWHILAEGSTARPATFDIEPLIDIPAGWHLFVYDVASGIKLALSELPYAFRLEGESSFVLIVGTPVFIKAEEQHTKIHLRPQIVSAAPNPFTRDVNISFYVPRRERVRLEVFSVAGRYVTTLADDYAEPGLHTVSWHGDTPARSRVSPGIYFLRFSTETAVQTTKLLKIH